MYSQRVLSTPILCSEDCYDFFKLIWDKNLLKIQEQVYIIYLNAGNEVICWRCVNTGIGSETLFDTKFVLACGISCLSSKILVAHNHPSNILKPSRNDIMITQKLMQASTIVGLKLEDHMIIGLDSYYSFADNGLMAG